MWLRFGVGDLSPGSGEGLWSSTRSPPPDPLICAILREVLDTFRLSELERGTTAAPQHSAGHGLVPLTTQRPPARPVNPWVPS